MGVSGPGPEGNTLKVSIVVLVHDALRYVRQCLRTLQRTHGVDHEILVVDNASRWPTTGYLSWAALAGRVGRLVLSRENLYYAKGNNLGAALSAEDSTHLVLLNSDVRIDSAEWLTTLLRCHNRGATAFGYVPEPVPRADGYCFLIDRDLYLNYRLDERFPWWWSLTKLQSQLLRDGWCVQAIADHRRYLHHYGGKSRVSRDLLAQSQRMDPEQVVKWFGERRVKCLDTL